MKKKLPVIKQSVTELQKKLKAEHDVQKRQRLQALYLIKTGQAVTRLEVAGLLSVHRHTVGVWLDSYERGGLESLLTIAKASGKKPYASEQVMEALKQRLAEPRGFASYGEIQTYLEQEHQVQLAYSSVHALVRYRLGAKPKSPRRSHPKKIRKKQQPSSMIYRRK